MRPLVIFLLALAPIALPAPARADGPAEQLAALAKQVDVALTRLNAGDRAGASKAYAAFDNGWFNIEDGVREQSRASYRAIEDAMGDAKYALQAEPFDAGKARAALQHLRAQCDSFVSQGGAGRQSAAAAPEGTVTIATLIDHLDAAHARLSAGDSAGAATAVAAFRRDWTEVEGLVKIKSAKAYAETENNMAKAYAVLTQQRPDLEQARQTLDEMKAELSPFAQGDVRYGVFDAAIILLREGLEALLVIAAFVAFLQKTGNQDKTRWIWAGSGAGVGASVVGAIIMTLLFSQAAAGSNRELIEGLTGLVAAAMLIYVSFWLHAKSSLGAWQQYIRTRTSAALVRNSLLSLAFIAFLAVFREGAETALFYIGIAPSIAMSDLLLGLGLGGLGLTLVGVLMLAFGVRIPIQPFFLATSALLYYLAFKFVGTGIHALQVAGALGATPADFLPENGLLGLFPTWETTVAQGVLLLLGAAVMLRRFLAGSKQHAASEQPVAG